MASSNNIPQRSGWNTGKPDQRSGGWSGLTPTRWIGRLRRNASGSTHSAFAHPAEGGALTALQCDHAFEVARLREQIEGLHGREFVAGGEKMRQVTHLRGGIA
jgi:hypothetical protein